MQEILDETLNELPTGESFHEGEFPDDMGDQLEMHEFGAIERQDFHDSDQPESVFEVESENSGMSMDQFKELKRK